MNIYSVTDEDIEMMIITSEFQIACTDMIRNDWPFESREESETPLFYAVGVFIKCFFYFESE